MGWRFHKCRVITIILIIIQSYPLEFKNDSSDNNLNYIEQESSNALPVCGVRNMGPYYIYYICILSLKGGRPPWRRFCRSHSRCIIWALLEMRRLRWRQTTVALWERASQVEAGQVARMPPAFSAAAPPLRHHSPHPGSPPTWFPLYAHIVPQSPAWSSPTSSFNTFHISEFSFTTLHFIEVLL